MFSEFAEIQHELVMIGSGIDTTAYMKKSEFAGYGEDTLNAGKVVWLKTGDSIMKYDYFSRLGLVASPIEKHGNGYVFAVTYLPELSNEKFAALDKDISKLRGDFNRYKYHYEDMIKSGYDTRVNTGRESELYAIRKIYANMRRYNPIFHTFIETLYDNRLLVRSMRFDMHGGNFRECPVTGKIYCYDPIVISTRIQ